MNDLVVFYFPPNSKTKDRPKLYVQKTDATSWFKSKFIYILTFLPKREKNFDVREDFQTKKRENWWIDILKLANDLIWTVSHNSRENTIVRFSNELGLENH